MLSKVSSHKKILWGRQLGIESLLDIYESVIEAETDFYNSLKGNEKKLSSEQRKNLDKFGYATSTAIANADVISYDKDEGFDMKISDSFVASLVGKNRIIKVGRAIHKYYPTQIKVIQDGDENKISLLDKIHETDKDKSIIVFNINKINRTTNGRVETPSRSLSCDKTDTGYPATFKIITYDEFEVAGITQGSDLQYYAIFNHKAKLRNLTRSWFGSWVNSVAAIQLSGSVYYYNSSWIALLNWSKPFYINPHNGHTVEEPLLYYQQLLYLNTPIYLTGQCDGANQNQSIFCRISY